MSELKSSSKRSTKEVKDTKETKGMKGSGVKGSVIKGKGVAASAASAVASSPASPASSASMPSTSTAAVVYFLGVARKNDPTIRSGLQEVYGIGRSTASTVCHALNIMPSVPFSRLSREEFQMLEQYVTDHFRVESDLRRRETEVVARHRSLGSVRGIRMRLGLPVRGQRTKSNAKTAKRLNRTRGT